MPKMTHRHSAAGDRTYKAWCSIRRRCASNSYYTSKGIKVCERWTRFEAFLEDLGEIPPGYSLDRIDPRGDYEPGNVRLATPRQQARNRTNNASATIGGETKLVCEWAEESGLSPQTIFSRIAMGWPPEDLLLPVNATRERLLTLGDRTMSLSDWARELGCGVSVIRNRLGRGWPVERALIRGRAGAAHPQYRPTDRPPGPVPTHGRSKTRTYRIWCAIRMRCKVVMDGSYAARGIAVCERWQSFENFLADLGEIPEGMSIDRIDVDRGYEPGNVRFADARLQARNRRSSRPITIMGVTKLLCEWVEETGLTRTCITLRIEAGIPEERWLEPSRSSFEVPITIAGVTRSATEWSRASGIKADTILARLKRGWPPERCIDPVTRP